VLRLSHFETVRTFVPYPVGPVPHIQDSGIPGSVGRTDCRGFLQTNNPRLVVLGHHHHAVGDLML